jgi:hypothetical protein
MNGRCPRSLCTPSGGGLSLFLGDCFAAVRTQDVQGIQIEGPTLRGSILQGVHNHISVCVKHRDIGVATNCLKCRVSENEARQSPR